MMRPRIGIVMPAMLVLVLATLYWVLERTYTPPDTAILPNHLLEFKIRSSRHQFAGYAALLLLLIVSVMVDLSPRSPGLRFPKRWGSSRLVLVLAITFWGALFSLGEFTPWFAVGFGLGLAGLAVARSRPAWATAAARLGPGLLVVGAVVYLVVFVIAPFFVPVPVKSYGHLVELHSHYAMTLMPGVDFSRDGLIQRSNYGLSMVWLTAIPFKLLPDLTSRHEAALVFVVRLYQVVAMAFIGCSIYLLNRKHWRWIFALALLLTPMLDTLGESLWYPNQGGIRYIPFLVGIVILVLARRVETTKHSAAPLGFAGGIIVVLSPECGIAVAAGFGSYLALMGMKRARPIGSALAAVGLYLLVLVCSFVVFSTLSLRLFYATATPSPLEFLRLFVSGYGSLVSKLDVFAGLLVFLGGHALIQGAWYGVRGRITPQRAYQSSIGVMILVWLPYYINRMNPMNLWFETVLLILLFAPSVPDCPSDVLNAPRVGFKAFYVATTVALFAALGAQSIGTLIPDAYNYVRLARASCIGSLSPIQGLCAEDAEVTEESRAIIHSLKQIQHKDEYLVLSHLSSGVRLHGFDRAFPWYEPFGEVAKTHDLRMVTTWIDRRGPPHLMVSNPTSQLSASVPNRTRHLTELVECLTQYEQVGNDPHWLYFDRE
jgi:hypothetical protein